MQNIRIFKREKHETMPHLHQPAIDLTKGKSKEKNMIQMNVNLLNMNFILQLYQNEMSAYFENILWTQIVFLKSCYLISLLFLCFSNLKENTCCSIEKRAEPNSTNTMVVAITVSFKLGYFIHQSVIETLDKNYGMWKKSLKWKFDDRVKNCY